MPEIMSDLFTLSNREQIEQAFDREALRRICEMPERRFIKAFGLEKVFVSQRKPQNWYGYRDNGSDVLFVAHLDTCVRPDQRKCSFADTPAGAVVHSGALDDRLGAYIGLDLLPKLGINVDILVTTGEESGQSTAQFFQPPKDKHYNWIIEFDRGGTDVVMYQYEDEDMCAIVQETGARVATGMFSDISYLEHLGVKAFNWGVGYQDYHSTRGYAWLDDTFKMVTYFVEFFDIWHDTRFDHEEDPSNWRTAWTGSYGGTGYYSNSRPIGGWSDDELEDYIETLDGDKRIEDVELVHPWDAKDPDDPNGTEGRPPEELHRKSGIDTLVDVTEEAEGSPLVVILEAPAPQQVNA